MFAHAQQARDHQSGSDVRAGAAQGFGANGIIVILLSWKHRRHAVVNTNDFAPGIRQIFSRTTILVVHQPTKDVADGTFRKVTDE